MEGACVRPAAMVTHNWANKFQDLVAAILADALDEAEYDMIAYMLTNELGRLMDWVEIGTGGQRSYWVCALLGSIQHSFCIFF